MDLEHTMTGTLTDIDFGGRGRFTPEPGGFAVSRYYLEKEWDYIFGDERLFWRISHNGRGYLQDAPPGGTYWLRQKGEDDPPAWQVHIVPEGDASRAFTNFRGVLPGDARGAADEGYECRWRLGSGRFRVERDGLAVTTELGVCGSLRGAIMDVCVKNLGGEARRVTVMPELHPWLTSAQPAAWDMPWLYQSTAYDPAQRRVCFEMGSPAGIPSARKQLVAMFDTMFDRMCLDAAAFLGRGTAHAPAARHGGDAWSASEKAMVYGIPLFAAFAQELVLQPGESWHTAMGIAEPGDADALSDALRNPGAECAAMEDRRREEIGRFEIETPDPGFNRYVNEFLGLQERLILRRGWPCNMMGVRDSAQDYTGAVAWYSAEVRAFIPRLLETERSDGWFLRQFSTDGRHGHHDARPYVDSGLWVWELVYEYVCQTRDFSLLDLKLPFLDSDEATSVRDHLGRLLGYYMNPANLGEHGLCKILEGDWNDSVNRAGLEGRGESVMVSCHLIYCLEQAALLAEHKNGTAEGLPPPDACRTFAQRMRKAIRASALNTKGYLNAVFSDTGRWLFSEKDPDGCERFNVPANAFGLIAGVFEKDEIPPLLERIRGLRKRYGYPLFTPALGDPPVDGVGRIGSGDLRPGLGENGTCYNHGCHGFLARAMAALGEGDVFRDVMLCLFPYDQERHPVVEARTAPYAIVNVYKGAPGREGEGGDTFFSGTIPVAARNIYQGMLGVYAEPAGLRIRPCFPADWDRIAGQIQYAGKPLKIEACRAEAGMDIRVDGSMVKDGWYPVPK